LDLKKLIELQYIAYPYQMFYVVFKIAFDYYYS